MQAEETVLASYGPTKTAALTMLHCERKSTSVMPASLRHGSGGPPSQSRSGVAAKGRTQAIPA